MNLLDNFINECDIALKTLSFKKSGTGRSYPVNETSSCLSKEEKNLSAQLMRVNLAGEVAAQALYRGQAMVFNKYIPIVASCTSISVYCSQWRNKHRSRKPKLDEGSRSST